jgi:hypothetical protein
MAEKFAHSLDVFTPGLSKKSEVPKLCVKEDESYTVIDIEEWLTKTSMLIWILDVVFRNVFSLQEVYYMYCISNKWGCVFNLYAPSFTVKQISIHMKIEKGRIILAGWLF